MKKKTQQHHANDVDFDEFFVTTKKQMESCFGLIDSVQHIIDSASATDQKTNASTYASTKHVIYDDSFNSMFVLSLLISRSMFPFFCVTVTTLTMFALSAYHSIFLRRGICKGERQGYI